MSRSDLSGTSNECAYSIAYSAPASCPDISSLERRLDSSYRVQAGTLAECEDCVRGIVIERAPDEQGYRLQIAGLESTLVTRRDCNELADFAIYAIEASDLPPPQCTKSSVSVGVSAAPLMNVSNADPLFATQLRLTVPVANIELTPFGFWLPQSQVRNQVSRDGRTLNPDWEHLSLAGYGAGLDACWPLVNGLFGGTNVLHLCGVGLWRRFTATPPAGSAAIDAELWALGGSVAWRIQVFDTINVELAPTVLVGLGDAATYATGTTDRLYQYGGVEAQMRIGVSWDFLVRHTHDSLQQARKITEPFRAASTSQARLRLARTRTHGFQRP